MLEFPVLLHKIQFLMLKSRRRFFFLILIFLTFIGFSCRKKDTIDTSPSLKLTFSADTVLFDTVFTTIGSITQRLLVYNMNDSKVRISSIRLAGGSNSYYKLNIDGSATSSLSDVEIPSHDSLFIFIRVMIDPNNHNTPLVVADSILFTTNGNLQDVKLVAWGQDAYFYKDKTLSGTVTFDSLKPHVVYGYLRIDTSGSLTLTKGCRLYFHSKSSLSVSKDATLNVEGTLEHPVLFTGDRLDPFYRDLPGQWDGINLERGSKANRINYAIIKNGSYGLTVDSLSSGNDTVLVLKNTIIQNMASSCLIGYATILSSVNCVIGNCGGTALSLINGGSYTFLHLTLANYWTNSVRVAPSLYISNKSFSMIPNNLVRAWFGNSILYGSNDNELTLDSVPAQFNYFFDHCLLKTTENISQPSHFSGSFINTDPLFIDPVLYNYQLDSLSPARLRGIPMGVDYDIKGVLRGNPPDLGAYQVQSAVGSLK